MLMYERTSKDRKKDNIPIHMVAGLCHFVFVFVFSPGVVARRKEMLADRQTD